MAPLTDAQREAAERRWMEASRDNKNHNRRRAPSNSPPNVKNNRDAQSGGDSKTPTDNDKGKFGGAPGGGNFGKGLKSNGNSNDNDKSKGNNDEDSSTSTKSKGGNKGGSSSRGGGNNNNNNNSNSDDNNGSKSGSSSNTNNAGAGSNTNNGNGNGGSSNGNDNNNNGNGSANTNNAGSAATATPAVIAGNGGSSDSNGAQQFSSESVEGTTTSIDTPTTVAPTTTDPPTVVLTTSTIVTTGPDAIVTSFVPLITTAATSDTTTTFHRPFAPFGPFGTNFPGFPTFTRPTGKSSSDDKKHKGVNGTTTDDDNNNNSGSNSNNNKGNNNNNNNNNNNKGNNNNNNKAKALDPTAERALISVGSIGAFIVICFIFWLVWRAFKKQKQKKLQRGTVSSFPSHDGPFTAISRLPGRVYDRVVNKIPFASRQRKAWQTLEETSTSNAGPTMTNNVAPSSMARAGVASYPEKGGDTLRTFGFESDLPPALPSLPSQVYYSSGLGLGLQFQSSPQQTDVNSVNRMPTGLMRSNSNVSAFTHSPAASFSSSIVSAQSVMPAAMPYGANNGTVNMGQPTGPVMVINEAGQQYLTDDIGSAASTMRSRMPDPFYNQSQLARQPSDAYDPARRQVNRASELSSLSSGFGDGEILMLASDQQQTQTGQMPISARRPSRVPSGPPLSASAGAAGRFSWMRKQRMSRETVYTESSEDQPAKFRSVNSWVKQQTGRVRRGQASIDTTTSASAGGEGGDMAVVVGNEPGIPHPMPAEQRLTMMDDGEEPRRPDTVPGFQMA